RVTDAGLPHKHLGAPTRMPGQVLGRPETNVNPTGARDDSYRLERVGGFDSAAGAPGASRFTQTRQHRGDVLRLSRQGRVQRGDFIIRGPAMDRDEFDTTGLVGRLNR